MPSNLFEEMDNEVDVSIFDLLYSFIEMLTDFLFHGFGILMLLNVVTIVAFKCSSYFVKLLWNTFWYLVKVNLPTEPQEKDQLIVTETKKVTFAILES